MKVLFVNSVCGYGSTGKIVERLAREVESRGGESLVCYGRYDYLGEVRAVKITSKTENYVNAFNARLLDNDGFGLKSPTKRLIKVIEEFKPDVINLHNLHGYYLNMKVLFEYLASTDIKIVWTLHDCWSLTGHCVHFEYAKCDKYLSGCFDCPQKKEYPTALLLDNSKNNYKKKQASYEKIKKENLIVVTPSLWLKNIVEKSILSRFETVCIYNGVDLQNFEYKKGDVKKTVLTVASTWTEKKGYKDVIELASRLRGEYKVAMVGVSDNQEDELNGTGIVAIKRTSNQKELAELYRNALVFVNPTYEDNFPTTNIEALASGTPVITYKTGGSVEVIEKGNGYVVKQGNIDDLINKIRLVEKDDFDRKAISDNAKAKYSDYKMSEKYMTIFNTLIKSR